MTAPLNPPSMAQIQALRMATLRPFKSVAFTHGGSDLDLTDPINGVAPCATEFFPTSTGNLVACLAGETSDRTFAVVAGTVVYGLFVLIKSTSTADGIART